MNINSVLPNLSVRSIIDAILAPDCPQVFPSVMWSGGYGSGILSGPTYPSWGSNPCQLQKLQQILGALSTLLGPLPRRGQLDLLNEIVVTFVPNQGETTITLLEAAIIMRWPGLVAQLLIMGASSNVSTSGVSLVFQLYEALPFDYQRGNGQDTQAIIDLLLQSGSYVPPGFPGTQGYLIPGSVHRRRNHL